MDDCGEQFHPGLSGILSWAVAFLWAGSAFADLSVRQFQIAPPAPRTQVPEVTAQGRFLAAQAVSAVDIAGDGKVITAGTMAFSHDANVWQFSPEGKVMAKRHFPPWAPMQVATLAGGKALAVGLAYSRVTSPDPTVWFGRSEDLFVPTLDDEFEEPDSADGQLARLRPGEGDWRRGWFASSLGELFVRGPDWVFKPPRWFLDAEGKRHELRFADRNLLPTNRALRMASSSDGRRLAFAWLGFGANAPRLPAHANALELWQIGPNQKLWSAPPAAVASSPLPNPATDFPELAKDFRLAADALVPGHAAAAVAVNRDGSRVAIIEYGVWGWVRNGPAIGKWDPPIHVLNFLPRQRGRLRVFDGSGRELMSELLPADGLFELGFGADGNDLWCWPGSWFARGMAGEVWLPVDRTARALFRIALGMGTADELGFPDVIAACAPAPAAEQALVSCWDGSIYLISGSGAVGAKHAAGAPARLAWKHDGAFAVAGTADGRLIRLEPDGTVSWNRRIEITEIPPRAWVPREVVPGLPVFQGGRISRAEHAYVGDIWVIKNGAKAVVVDAGGLSGFSETQARLRALEVNQVTHVVQTHSHGDHCGGAYLFRAAGAQIVGPKSAAFTLTWLMPMLTDYGIYPPRPLDVALPLGRVGDEADFEASGLNFHALFVPGHSFDLTLYTTILAGRRVAFTGDLGFENQDIVHRCWGDAAKAREVVRVIRNKLLPWQPEIVFTGHGVRPNGIEFLATLVRATENSLQGLEPPR